MRTTIAALLALIALAGCNMLRLGYGQIDVYAAWQADAYFGLDQAQRQEFNKRFDRLHEWHRHNQLPEYAAFLAAMKERIQRGPTNDDARWVTEGVMSRYRALVKYASDDMAAMLMTVTPAQLETLKQRWEKDNRRFASEHKLKEGAEAQRRAAARRALERIREWTGNLSVEQEDKIAVLAAELPMNHHLRHEDRMRRQREFLQLMAQREDPRKFAERLRQFMTSWEQGRDPEYQRLWEQWARKQAEFYVAVYRMLTPQQRAAVERRIQNYIDDFTRLAQRPAGAAPASAHQPGCCGDMKAK
jgi:hypothetical protein